MLINNKIIKKIELSYIFILTGFFGYFIYNKVKEYLNDDFYILLLNNDFSVTFNSAFLFNTLLYYLSYFVFLFVPVVFCYFYINNKYTNDFIIKVIEEDNFNSIFMKKAFYMIYHNRKLKSKIIEKMLISSETNTEIDDKKMLRRRDKLQSEIEQINKDLKVNPNDEVVEIQNM